MLKTTPIAVYFLGYFLPISDFLSPKSLNQFVLVAMNPCKGLSFKTNRAPHRLTLVIAQSRLPWDSDQFHSSKQKTVTMADSMEYGSLQEMP